MSQRLATRRQIAIRSALREDAEAIADLATQLGYPSSPGQVRSRLERIQNDPDHATFVAELEGHRVIGWVHVSVRCLVESDPEAEIGGLIVDEEHRGSGAGRLLMEQAEQWARAKGLPSVYLRSNVVRQAAHAFYTKLDYQVVKTQHAFRKFI